MNLSKIKKQSSVLVSLLFVYIILFEFILPVNKILPKPSLLWESFGALWENYNFLNAMMISTSVIYGAIILGYVIISLVPGVLAGLFDKYNGLINGLSLFRFFPAFFYAILFAYWFPDSIGAEFIFALSGSLFFMGLAYGNGMKNIKEEYLLAAKSLNATDDEIYKGIVWKSCQPEIFNALPKVHYYVWGMVMVFEYVANYAGFGSVYNSILSYHDFSALFAVAIIISLLIWIGNMLIGFAAKQIIYWEA